MNTRQDLRQTLATRWAAFTVRERMLVTAMSGALAFLLVWMTLVRPAWQQLDRAPARRAALDLQMLQLRALVDEGNQLRAVPPVPSAQARLRLQAATDALGAKGRLQLEADKATLTLHGATGEDLRQWLAQARDGAHARPIAADLTHLGDGYNGSLVMSLGDAE